MYFLLYAHISSENEQIIMFFVSLQSKRQQQKQQYLLFTSGKIETKPI